MFWFKSLCSLLYVFVLLFLVLVFQGLLFRVWSSRIKLGIKKIETVIQLKSSSCCSLTSAGRRAAVGLRQTRRPRSSRRIKLVLNENRVRMILVVVLVLAGTGLRVDGGEWPSCRRLKSESKEWRTFQMIDSGALTLRHRPDISKHRRK